MHFCKTASHVYNYVCNNRPWKKKEEKKGRRKKKTWWHTYIVVNMTDSLTEVHRIHVTHNPWLYQYMYNIPPLSAKHSYSKSTPRHSETSKWLTSLPIRMLNHSSGDCAVLGISLSNMLPIVFCPLNMFPIVFYPSNRFPIVFYPSNMFPIVFHALNMFPIVFFTH